LRIFDFNSAIVRTPGRSVVDGLRAVPGPAPIFDTLVEEHRSYVAALRAAGVHVTVLEALEPHPDSVFVEDPALVFTQAAVMLRPGAPSRQAEAPPLAATLAARFPHVLQLSEGFADGGDVLATPDRIFIGLSARTDPTGAAALARILGSLGFASRVVRVPAGTLHLKTDCSLIDEDTVLATRELAAARLIEGLRVLVVPDDERAAANALRVNDVVFIREGFPRTREILLKHGVEVTPLPADEVGKLDAGLSCMSLRWLDAELGSAGA
jgi:dimethylargininase